MTVEPDNTPLDEDVTDNDALSDDDNLEDFDYFDPDEDTEEVEETEGTDDEADETEAEDEAEGQEADEDDEPDSNPDDVVVKMEDGTEIAVSELKASYLRQSDYTRKSQALSNERKGVAEKAQNVEGITNALVDFLAQAMPEEPSLALAAQDPNRYTREKAQYDQAVKQLEKLIETGRQAGGVTSAMSDEDRQRDQQAQNAALVEMFPEVSDPAKRTKFLADAAEAAKAIGYSDEDLAGVYDSKTIALAHWAKKGMDAEKARKTAKAKAAKAPPVSPKKPAGSRKGSGNAEAMRKLSRSGSIEDALAIDFD